MLSGTFHGSTCINQLTLWRNTCYIHSLQYGTCYILVQQSLISFNAMKMHFMSFLTKEMGDSYAFLEKVQEKHIEKWRMKIKKQVLPVDVPKDKLENLSYLFPSSCFLPFFLSVWPKFNSSPTLISISYHCPGSSPHLSSSLSIHLSSPFVPFTPPLSFSRLSFCHFAPLSVPVPLRFSSVTSSPALPVLSVCFAANVCDEEMLLCQNGGTCFQNQKCICPPEFKGVLCQQSRCEAGKDCNAASSLRPATLLICTLLAHMLAMLTPH